MSRQTKDLLGAAAAVLMVFVAGFLNIAILVIFPIVAAIAGIVMLFIYIRKRYLRWLEEVKREAREQVAKEQEIKELIKKMYDSAEEGQ